MIIIVAAFIAAFWVSENYVVAYEGGSFSAIPKNRQSNWRGFFVDYPGLGETERVTYEDFNLNFSKAGIVTGTSRGSVKVGSTDVAKTYQEWWYFLANDLIYMTFRTIADDRVQRSSTSGLGNLILKRTGTNYSGYLFARDHSSNKIIRCPYVLTAEVTVSIEQAVKRWRPLGNQCEVITIPDAS